DNRAGAIHPVPPESARWSRRIPCNHPEGGRGAYAEGNARGIDAVGADIARRAVADRRKPARRSECRPPASPRRAQPTPRFSPVGERKEAALLDLGCGQRFRVPPRGLLIEEPCAR